MKFLEEAELANLNETERLRYERSLKLYRDNELLMYSARMAGIAEGKAEGKAEALHDTARRMLQRNIDTQTVMEVTGLSFDTVADLKSAR